MFFFNNTYTMDLVCQWLWVTIVNIIIFRESHTLQLLIFCTLQSFTPQKVSFHCIISVLSLMNDAQIYYSLKKNDILTTDLLNFARFASNHFLSINQSKTHSICFEILLNQHYNKFDQRTCWNIFMIFIYLNLN